ncbi:viroplasmin family protein, partial [Candidatus Liberibacter asiaticus]
MYVVYNGPKLKIYISWSEANRAIIGLSGVIHRFFTNMKEAKEIFTNY